MLEGRDMESDNQIRKNTLLNVVKNVFGIIFPLITFPYISRVLMTDNVGKVNFGNSIISYFSLLASLGVSTYAIRECSKVKSDKNELSKKCSEIFSINLVSTLISYLILGAVLLTSEALENYRLLIMIQGTAIMFATLGADWLNTAMEDFKYITIRTVVIQFVSILLMFIFVRKQEDYIKYAVINVIASNGASVINMFYRRRFCKIHFTLKMNLKKHLVPIVILFSFLVSSIICTNSDITILGLIKGDNAVGLYSTAVKIYNLANTVVASITWVVIPQLSIGFSAGNYEDVNKLLKFALNFILVFGLPVVAGIEIIAPHLIVFIAGEAYMEAAMPLQILGIALMLSFIGGWMGNLTMLPAGREKIFLLSTTVSAIVNIILNFIMIPIWGCDAAAFTTAVSQLTGILVLFPFMDKNIKISRLQEILKAPLVGAAGITLIGYIIQRIIDSSWIISVATIGISFVWYCFILIIMRNEFFIGYLSPIIKKIKK